MNKQHEEIAQILADNICYSPQVQGVVIHGVVDKLADREDKAEERGYKRGSFHTWAIAIAAIFVAQITFSILDSPHPIQTNHDVTVTSLPALTPSQQKAWNNYKKDLIDTVVSHGWKASDLIFFDPPETKSVGDSATRAERREGKQ